MADSTPVDLMRAVAGLLSSQAVPDAVDGVAQVLVSAPATPAARFYVVVTAGRVCVSEGTHPEPDVTLRLEESDLKALVAGDLSAASAYMSGRAKLDGDHSLLIDGWRPISESAEVQKALKALR